MSALWGWAGRIRRVDLSQGTFSDIPTMTYADRFIGGKGIASRLYWELLGKETSAFSPDNHLFMMNGPLAGIPSAAASRWVVVSRSPLTYPEEYACGNLGGYFGATLKWAGLDGLDIFGVAKKPVVLVIQSGGRCVLEDATELWGKDALTTISLLRERYGMKVSVAAIGEAGEMRVRFANIIGSDGASTTKGFGAVMGSKNLKAVVVKAPSIKLPIARPDEFKRLIGEVNTLTLGEASGRYYKEVKLDGVQKISNAYCYGCSGICRRGLFRAESGEEGYRINCASAFFYRTWEKARLGTGGPATFYATQLANKHGICALELALLCKWLPGALRDGVTGNADSNLDPDQIGTPEWIHTLIGTIISREGIGDVLAEGSRRAAQEWGISERLEGKVSRAGISPSAGHDPRLFLSLVPVFATEPNYVTTQVHGISKPMRQWMAWANSNGKRGFLTTEKLRHLARQYWGDERAAEFDSPDMMGAAAAHVQNRAYAKENLVACDWFWPISFSGNVKSGTGDPTLEARLFSAVTGEDMTETGYLLSGERCCNQNRAIYLREGRRGRPDDVLEDRFYTRPFERSSRVIAAVNPEFRMPGTNGMLVSRKGATIDRDVFRQIMDDYYQARGWDVATGFFKEDGLDTLGLADMAPELKQQGFLA
jgi:aldehyde:ferredoxin oxidoreductase